MSASACWRSPRPDEFLAVGSGSHAEQTTKALFGFERKIDSASSPATSSSPLRLAAVKLVVQVAHIEFGLRCFNRVMPQEHNCVLADYLTDILLAHSGEAILDLSTHERTRPASSRR